MSSVGRGGVWGKGGWVEGGRGGVVEGVRGDMFPSTSGEPSLSGVMGDIWPTKKKHSLKWSTEQLIDLDI